MGAKPDLIASSDLLRAQRTAELIALALGYERPLVIDTDLRERDAGEWNGLTGEEIAASWPEELQAFREGRRAAPGGEANDHFAERSGSALRRLAGMGNAEAIVVTHGGVVHALQVALGAVAPENHGSNLCGWWTESRGALPDLALIPLSAVDLLAASTGTQRTGT
jgi:probable phosphoglycerate mutase